MRIRDRNEAKQSQLGETGKPEIRGISLPQTRQTKPILGSDEGRIAFDAALGFPYNEGIVQIS